MKCWYHYCNGSIQIAVSIPQCSGVKIHTLCSFVWILQFIAKWYANLYISLVEFTGNYITSCTCQGFQEGLCLMEIANLLHQSWSLWKVHICLLRKGYLLHPLMLSLARISNVERCNNNDILTKLLLLL